MPKIPQGLKDYLRTPFVVIVWIMETYAKNRERMRAFMAQPRTARAFKIVISLTVLAWIVVALTASDEQGQRLTDALKAFWAETQSLGQAEKP